MNAAGADMNEALTMLTGGWVSILDNGNNLRGYYEIMEDIAAWTTFIEHKGWTVVIIVNVCSGENEKYIY